ncbi:hypothetical protein MRGR3_2388 [Staphylococcus aureus subsp. aureus MRGR3]|nr:hypothetical protein MRGR3_2388 [Staphylococcus aureus subsp. aureus MRGR3]
MHCLLPIEFIDQIAREINNPKFKINDIVIAIVYKTRNFSFLFILSIFLPFS